MEIKNDDKKPSRPAGFVLSRKLDRMFLELYNVYAFIARFFKEVFLPPYESKKL